MYPATFCNAWHTLPIVKPDPPTYRLKKLKGSHKTVSHVPGHSGAIGFPFCFYDSRFTARRRAAIMRDCGVKYPSQSGAFISRRFILRSPKQFPSLSCRKEDGSQVRTLALKARALYFQSTPLYCKVQPVGDPSDGKGSFSHPAVKRSTSKYSVRYDIFLLLY